MKRKEESEKLRLSQEEYKEKFLHNTEYIKKAEIEPLISQPLAEEFSMKYNEKAKHWYGEWENNQRFVVKLFYPKGTHLVLLWGYNYDFIPLMNNRGKFSWYRTEKAIKIHLEDSWYDHIEYQADQEWGFSAREFYNPEQCPAFEYRIPVYTSDKEFALEYIKTVIDNNILLMKEWLDKVKTIADAIEDIENKISRAISFYRPYLLYVSAFLYAQNQDIHKALLAMEEYYENREIPQVLLDKLEQLVQKIN